MQRFASGGNIQSWVSARLIGQYLGVTCRSILINATQLRIEYHPASDGATTKTPDDAVTVDLATGTLTTYTPAA
jgi:hypothetical protein